ncbi:hypothetical protein GCM10027200_51920 [Lentzea nigeriaca]
MLEVRDALAHDVERAFRTGLRVHLVSLHDDRGVPGTSHRQGCGQPGYAAPGDRETHPFRLGMGPNGGQGHRSLSVPSGQSLTRSALSGRGVQTAVLVAVRRKLDCLPRDHPSSV